MYKIFLNFFYIGTYLFTNLNNDQELVIFFSCLLQKEKDSKKKSEES